MNIYGKAVLVWLLIAFVETLHGMARAKFLVPRVGDFRSRQIGVFTGTLLIYTITGFTYSWLNPTHDRETLGVGGIWLGLMLLFEFMVGHYVFRFPWKWLIDEYNVMKGKLLLLGMILLFLAPYGVGRLLR